MPEQSVQAAKARPAQPALDLHEGIGDPGRRTAGCARWPEHLRLLNQTTGELRPGRCRATNLCRYCQRLYVVETVEMLTLDAVEHAPTLWVVLTAREHLTRSECRDHLRQLLKAARRRWPAVEWFVQVEFQRRGALHLNLLVKGVPASDVDELRAVLVERWCRRVDAEPVGQWADTVEDAGGAVRYLSKMLAHGLKAEQAPPIGWRGHRTSQTRGYLVRPASVMRQEARRALRLKRLLHRGLDLETAELELAAADSDRWELRQVLPLSADPDDRRRRAARAPFGHGGAPRPRGGRGPAAAARPRPITPGAVPHRPVPGGAGGGERPRGLGRADDEDAPLGPWRSSADVGMIER